MASRELRIDLSPLVEQVKDHIRETVEPWALQMRRERIVLQLAVEDIRDHAEPIGLLHEDDPEGSPHHYVLTVGALHRALGVLAGGVPRAWEPEIARRLALDAALEPDQTGVADRPRAAAMPFGTVVRVTLHGHVEDWVRESPDSWRSMSGGGSASDEWIGVTLEQGTGRAVERSDG